MQDGSRAVGFFSSSGDPSSWMLSQRGPLEECGTDISDARDMDVLEERTG